MKQQITFMKNISKSIALSIKLIILLIVFNFNTFAQGSKTFVTGSYIVNMGQHSGTIATDISKELTPWGMVYDLLKNYNVPIYVVINPTKAKDGIDFTYNGINYKGGTFVIDKKNISSTVATRIAYWATQGMSGAYTISNLTLNTTIRYSVVPKWTLDLDNGDLVIPVFANAKIPDSAYNRIIPSQLGACNDIFVLPHADPTWAVHGNLLNWNLQYKGSIYISCHAGSTLHNTYNPANTSQQMNFLTTKTSTRGSGITLPVSGSTNYSENSLQLYSNAADATIPYNTCTGAVRSGTLANAADPVAQYMGVTDLVHSSFGSERNFVPAKGQSWLSTTKIICYDSTSPNVPSISNGPDVLIAYGRGFGDTSRGLVMLNGGHDLNRGTIGDVAAQRAFWNWSFLAAQDKAIKINSVTGIPVNGIVTSNSTYNLSVNYSIASSANTNLTFTWSCIQTSNSTSFGSFSPNGSNASSSTVFTPTVVTTPTDVVIQIVIRDGCGRQSFESYPVTIVPNKVNISGTVWNDVNRSANNTFTNIFTTGEQGTNVNNSLYVYCLDQNGFVIALDTVKANGTYTLINLPTSTNGLSLVLSSVSAALNSYSPTAVLSAQGWINTTPLTRGSINTLAVNLTSMDWGVDAFPIARYDYFSNYQNISLINTVATNDSLSGNGGNTWAIINSTTHGQLTLNPNGSFTYVPVNNYTGKDTFRYKICDADGDCDTAYVFITVTPFPSSSTTITSCNSYTWSKIIRTISGTYYDTIHLAHYDSIAVLHLTINYGTHNSTTQTACESYSWNSNSYTASGTYTYSYNNTDGCPSVDTLHLTVNYGTHNSTTQTACESYSWNSNSYTASGTYTYSYNNTDGCPSVDTLHLTVNYGTHNSTTQTSVGSYSWNSNTYTSSGTYTYSYNTINSCPSVDTLHLVINDVPVAVNDTYAPSQDSTFYGNVGTNDTLSNEGGNNFTLISGPSHGTITFNSNGTFAYTPTIGFTDSDTFYYSLCDTNNNCSTAMVVLVIQAGGTTPVTLTSFNARLLNSENALLNWITQSEINTSHYDVERSEDGIHFTKRAAKNATGSPTISQNYDYTDLLNTNATIVYYRLKIVDNDGSFKYSNIVPLKLKDVNNEMSVYPNPFISSITIELTSQTEDIAKVKMMTIDGRTLNQFDVKIQKGKNVIPVNNLGRLPKSTYLLEVKTTAKTYIKRIVKN